MANTKEFKEAFQRLREILVPYAAKLNVVADTDTNYYLETHYVMENKRRLFFAAVRLGKAYVSFHLMPVYASPEIINGLSPELRKHMQGKSCFNFKTVDEKLFKELEKLTKLGFKKFSDPAFVKTIFRREQRND
jgi:hypothetical protein